MSASVCGVLKNSMVRGFRDVKEDDGREEVCKTLESI
jgi:hypothetical protein